MHFPQHAPGHQSTPPTMAPRQQTPSSSVISSTPRRHPAMARTPYAAFLPREHIYPSTAPLPQIPAFLGSPFSTKTARGRYLYDTASPSKGVMTERLSQTTFEHIGLDWLGRSEWMVDETTPVEDQSETESEQEDLPADPPRPPSRSRRGTSGSTSSMDDFSGSGTSSASLPSLGRHSGEHHIRPSIVTIWDEEKGELDDQEGDPATPGRQPFKSEKEVDGALHMSAKTARRSPGLSPLVDERSSSSSTTPHLSPLRTYFLSRGPAPKPTTVHVSSPSPAKPTRSPLSGFLPRLLSSSKKTMTNGLSSAIPRSRSPRQTVELAADSEEVMTDTEDTSSDAKDQITRRRWGSPKLRGLHGEIGNSFDSPFGSVIGLGIQASTERSVPHSLRPTTPFARSISSESSGEIDVSPSKFLSARASGGKPTPALPTTFINPVMQARRKTLAAPVQVPLKTTPAMSAVRPRPMRPTLRRGITEHRAIIDHSISTPTSDFLSVHTPFADIRPSPVAFASTGLVRKKSIAPGSDIPKFGQVSKPVKPVKSASLIKPPTLTGSSDAIAYVRAA